MTITLLLTSEGKKMGKTAGRRCLARPEQDQPLRLLPVLAQHRRRRRHELPAQDDLPASRADRRDGHLEGRQDQRGQGRYSLGSSPAWSTAKRRPTAPAKAPSASVSAAAVTENMPTTELTADDLADGSVRRAHSARKDRPVRQPRATRAATCSRAASPPTTRRLTTSPRPSLRTSSKLA